MRRRLRGLPVGAPVCLALLWAEPSAAGPPTVSVPVSPESYETGLPSNGPFGFLAGTRRSNYLLGDMWGLRPLLSQYGMSLAVQETSEVLGNLTGGARQGVEYDGLTQMVLQLDTQRAFGWHGGLVNISALQIHGRSLSADNLLTLQTSSGIEAERATRMWELWYQQKFGEDDRYDVKLGQQSLDQEFMVSQSAAIFVNTMFGWPMLPSADLPGGGPAYPLSAPGVRLRGHPFGSWWFLAGVFSGSPDHPGTGDPQRLNASGTTFPWNGTLAIAELQYIYPSLGTMLYADQAEPRARTIKFGFWYDTKQFPDQQIDNTGLSLANPASAGTPLQHRGDWAIYAVMDQTLWVDPHEADRTITAFIRPMGTPLGERNLIDFSLNAGLVMREPILRRDDDTFGIGMGYTHVSRRAAALDADAAFYSGVFAPVRGGETYLEATYQYQVAPWLQLQPDFQYILNPGAGIANPTAPTQRVKDEAVLGVRTTILF